MLRRIGVIAVHPGITMTTTEDLERDFALAVEQATGLADASTRFRVLVLFAGRGDHHHVCDVNVARRGGTFGQQRTYDCDSTRDGQGAHWFDRFMNDWRAGVFGPAVKARTRPPGRPLAERRQSAQEHRR